MRHSNKLFILAFIVSGCSTTYQPPSQDDTNVALVTVVNSSTEKLSVAKYQDAASCANPVWLVESKLIEPSRQAAVRVKANELHTLLFTKAGISQTGSTVTTSWCYVALSFIPSKADHYRFTYNSDSDHCYVESAQETGAGKWAKAPSVKLRDTSKFNAERVSPCADKPK